MKLHLISGEVVEIFRLTCAHYIPDKYQNDMCNWNIDPVHLVYKNADGYFAIGKWGCDGHWDKNTGRYIRTPENFTQLILIHKVMKITETEKWELEEDLEDVELIASGYEWECPECEKENIIGSIPVIGNSIGNVNCEECGKEFSIGVYDHCFD